MQNIQLYIEGQRLELFKDESVVLTQTIQNVKDIEKIFTDFSKTFNVPATKENNKIFKHFYDFNITNGFDARIKKSAVIELNYATFRNGKIKLEGVQLKDNKASSYRITFFGNTIELKDLLGEDKLSSLSGLNTLNDVYGGSEMQTALGVNPSTNDLIVPLITHTKRLTYDSSGGHSAGGIENGNVYYDAAHLHGVYYKDLKYAIRVDVIVQEIAAAYGLVFSDDFFVSTNAPYYNLFLWLHREKGAVNEPEGSVVYSFVDTWSLDTSDPTGSGMTSTSTLSINNDFLSKLQELTLTLKTVSVSSYRVSLKINGLQVYRSDPTIGDLTITKSDFTPATGDYTVEIQSDAAITFTEVNWLLVSLDFITITLTNYTSASYSHTTAFDFIISQQMPEIKTIDFITGIFKMFNLTAYVDDASGNIIVKTLDEYYEDGTSYDITKYIKIDDSVVDAALPYREISFEHGDTKTFLANNHKQLFNKTWGRSDYTNGEKLDGKLYKIKTPFSQLKNERIRNQSGLATSIQYGYYVDDKQDAYFGKPLLFYPIRITSGETISFMPDGSSVVELSSYNIPSNSVDIDPLNSVSNMNFFNEVNEYTNTNDFTDTLFQSYYSKYIGDIFNPINRLTKVTAYLPLKILLNYTLADTFNMTGNSYKINSVKTNLLTGKSEIELLNNIVAPTGTVPPTDPPLVPDGLASSDIDTNSFTLCWDTRSDYLTIETYNIYLDGVLKQIVLAAGRNGTLCSDINKLTTGTTYDFTVSATDFSDVESAQSAALEVITL